MKFRMLLLATALTFAGAFGGEASAQTLNVVSAGDQNMVDYVNNYLAPKFEAMNPGVKVRAVGTGPGDSGSQKIYEKLSAQQKANVADWDIDVAVVHQREVGIDAQSFERALRSALREDPDVVLVGEMRDPESIAITLTLAETGHLVVSSLHTNDASQTLDRIVDVFPAERQGQIRQQLASTISAVVAQRLVPRIGSGLIAAAWL